MTSLILSGLILVSPVPMDDRAAFERLKGLTGTWTGVASHGETIPDMSVVYKTTAAGTAVVETLFPGKPHEMVTVYTLDGGRLRGTHYCSMGNQPTLYMTGGDDKSITLEFKEGGNIKAGDSHMHKAVITFLGADRLKSAWYPMVGGKLGEPATFDLKRQK